MWCGSLTPVHVLIATDADYMVDDVTAALGGPDVSFTVCRDGRQVADLVLQRSPDLAVLDLQSGSMGAMAVMTARVAGRRVAGLAVLFVLTSLPVVGDFRPLRIDHHAWQMSLLAISMPAGAAKVRMIGTSAPVASIGASPVSV